MPKIEAKAKAAELQRQIATLTGHDLAQVKPYGKHLLIQMHRDDSVDTIARLTEFARNSSPLTSHSRIKTSSNSARPSNASRTTFPTSSPPCAG
jgi:formamidopyrimidine-DNA glycosylase